MNNILKDHLLILFVTGIILIYTTDSYAGKYPDARPTPPPVMQPVIKQPLLVMRDRGVFEIGGCQITKKNRRVEFQAMVSLTEGMLEYLIVGTKGRINESLLQTSIDPYALQVALLMTGLEGTLNTLQVKGESRIPEGDRINISVSWQENGKDVVTPIENLVRIRDKEMKFIPWVFTGSKTENGIFLGQERNSIIALYHDPAALIDHQLNDGNNNSIWFVADKKVPPAGTILTVIIEKIPDDGKNPQ